MLELETPCSNCYCGVGTLQLSYMYLHSVLSYQSRHSLHFPKLLGTGKSILKEARSLLLLALCILRLRVSQKTKKYYTLNSVDLEEWKMGWISLFQQHWKKFWGWAGCAQFMGRPPRTPHLHRLQVPEFSAELCWTRSEQSTWLKKKKKWKEQVISLWCQSKHLACWRMRFYLNKLLYSCSSG